MSPSKSKKILYCVLNWGLGHATRSIPIIKQLLSYGWEVHLASDGIALEYLRNEFPHLHFLELAGYNINYRGKSTFWIISRQIPKMYMARAKEHVKTKKYVQNNHINAIISDNRFGCYVNNKKSIFITHQWNLLQSNQTIHSFASKLNQWMITRYFDEVWIPDDPELNMSGILSKNNPDQKYTGIISRLHPSEEKKDTDIDVLVILSGPEPSRTRLESKIISLVKDMANKNIHIVRGTNKNFKSKMKLGAHIHIHNMLNTSELEQLIHRTSFIVSRSGYTSLLDYFHVGIQNLLLIPTPYQTEQVYLANYCTNQFDQVYTTSEKELTKNHLIEGMKRESIRKIKNLNQYLSELISSLHE